MNYEEFKAARKAEGKWPATKEEAYNAAREQSIKDAAGAICMRFESLRSLIGNNKKR